MVGVFEPLSQPNVSKEAVLIVLSHHFSCNQEASQVLDSIKDGFAALWLFDPEVARCALDVEHTEYDVLAYEAAAKQISGQLPGFFVNFRRPGSFGVGHADGSTAQIQVRHLRGKGRGDAFVAALKKAVMEF